MNVSNMDADIERLKELSDRLTKLLADDERGLTTWFAFVSDVIAEMYVITASGAKH